MAFIPDDEKTAGGALLRLADDAGIGRDWLGGHEERMRTDLEYARIWNRRDADARAAKEAAAQAERNAIADRRRATLVEAGVPEKDLVAILGEQLKHTDAMLTARDWQATEERILVLGGDRGVGKTTAAAWLACQVHGARFLDATRLMRVDTYSDESMNPLERCPLLVLDDLGTEYADVKGKLSSLVDGLVNTRYAGLRRTVVTTNLNASQFKLRYGERIADRIREAGRFVELGGESLRGRKAGA
jgi:DNA replication protein DnaC